MHNCDIIPTFAANKRRKELDMTLFGAIAIGVVFGIIGGVIKHFLNPEDSDHSYKPKKKSWWFTKHDWIGPVGGPMV